MDLTFTPEQERYRLKVRSWLDGALPPDWDSRGGALPLDESAMIRFLIDWEQRLYEAGYIGASVSKEYGGQGHSIIEHFIVAEELGRRAAPEGINSIGRELVVPILLAAGTQTQKQRFIPEILGCREIWCQGFSESNAGSDLAAIATHAVRDGGRWKVSGRKIWTSYANQAKWCLLLARTDSTLPKHKGLTIFAMPMDTPGIHVQPLTQITGRSEFNELLLEDVELSEDSAIGPVNGGWRVAGAVLTVERATNRMYRQARFLNELMALASRISESELGSGMDSKIGELYADLHILRCHNLKMVSRITSGEKIGPESSLIKLMWSELHQRLTAVAAEALGTDFSLQQVWGSVSARFQDVYLQSRAETIYAGTSQIQKNIIADRVLNLPRSVS